MIVSHDFTWTQSIELIIKKWYVSLLLLPHHVWQKQTQKKTSWNLHQDDRWSTQRNCYLCFLTFFVSSSSSQQQPITSLTGGGQTTNPTKKMFPNCLTETEYQSWVIQRLRFCSHPYAHILQLRTDKRQHCRTLHHEAQWHRLNILPLRVMSSWLARRLMDAQASESSEMLFDDNTLKNWYSPLNQFFIIEFNSIKFNSTSSHYFWNSSVIIQSTDNPKHSSSM